jgi:hypothetical protein
LISFHSDRDRFGPVILALVEGAARMIAQTLGSGRLRRDVEYRF